MNDWQKNLIALTLLEALYEINNKYPKDPYLADRVAKICFLLNLSDDFVNVPGFFELYEDAGSDPMGEHYKSVIERKIAELNEIRKEMPNATYPFNKTPD
jgi:hypothetical protein